MRTVAVFTLFTSLCPLPPAHAGEAAERAQIAAQLDAGCKSGPVEPAEKEALFVSFCTCMVAEASSRFALDTLRAIASGNDELSEAENALLQDSVTLCLEKAGQP